jgi:hypothetical protein
MSMIRTGEALAAEVARRVALCTVAQGAETDLGLTVYDGRRKVSDDMLPCAVIIEGVDKPGRVTVGTQIEQHQQYVIYAYVPCDPSAPNVQARQAIRDLKRAIFTTAGKADPTWSRTVRLVTYLGKDIGPRADGAAFVLAAVEFAVEFVEDLAAP